MKIQIETSKLFSGKIYAQNRPRSCMNDIMNQLDFELSIPYADDDDYNNTANHSDFLQCDTKQPTPGYFTNDIIIQHHDLVLTTKDLALDQMGKDIDEVSIGDLLRVQIRMSDEDTYGIFVRNLIAKDDQNPKNNFTLIDNKGFVWDSICPVQMKMMREVRLLNENRKTLESYLEAFTFTGGSILVIQVEVETCLDKCKPVQCQVANGRSFPGVEMVTSYGRRRKRRSASSDDDVDDQIDNGEVISKTKLSKSLRIRKKRELISSDLNSITSTTSMDEKQFENENETHTRIAFDSFLTPYHKISISSKNYLCFEPTHLFIICVIACCAQISLFSLVFGIIIRVKKVPCQKRHLLTSSGRRIGASSSSSSWNMNPSSIHNNSTTPYNYMSSM
ncbi:Zona pellucida-like domain containing protein [Euroglyphus maynei]|uniref:Zona pellucida-like domain containing protein n=1 Tax=Euroglyphus maynei TaxID=6958 RepID=A0A1Y3B0A6_EURMA|nr:Zona pellucida-like domain containing protein [Euroglyphus maynei]